MRKNGLLLFSLLSIVGPIAMRAQVRPTTSQAQQILQSRPDVVASLRARLLSSGLTPDQVRSRLRAEGYPGDLLDGYLPDRSGRPAADTAVSARTIIALRRLGVVDSLAADTLLGVVAPPSVDSTMAESETADADSGMVFGHDLFRRNTSQFEPNLAGPVDENYRLGPGDQLVLVLTGDVEEAHELDVTREGFIVVPRVGQLYVANLSLGDLNELLFSRLSRVYSGVRRENATTHFSVSVSRLRTNQVFVAGDVRRPGSYRVSSAGTALTALYAAGGPTENGTLRRVTIRRGRGVVDTLDVYDYLVDGDASHDPRLQSGDVIFVPVRGPRVEIRGEIVRPAIYELKAGETLADLIRMAGGFGAFASRSRIQIERVLPPQERQGEGSARVVIDVTMSPGAPDVPAFDLEAGDAISVFPVSERVRGRIMIIGNVWQPGPIGFTAGMTLARALERAGGVKPDSYLGQVLITRLNPDSTRGQLRGTLRDSSGAVIDDIPLREDDEVRVFSRTEFRPSRSVAISGAVQRPGQHEFREGMTLRDLVLMAGGLQQSADLREAEIARLPESRENGTTASTVRVPLDSTYLFERGPDGRYLGPPGIQVPAASAPDVRLSPYDNVLILQQPGWELLRTVHVGGEVRFPGRYTLTRSNEKLADVLQRVGGITPDGYPEGIEFIRTRGNIGRIGIDLQRVLRDARHRDNLLLEDGDSLHLPRYNPVVNVGGAVNSPVAVAYVPGRDLGYYIRAAGGPSRNADNARAFVLQPNGSVESRGRSLFLFRSEPAPRAGSVVTVPARDPADRRDFAATATLLSQLLASLVAVIAITRR
ncbi:MAG: SLBB domain-containing protein [Gemmatimonadota bacterium]